MKSRISQGPTGRLDKGGGKPFLLEELSDLGMWPKGLFTQRASGWAYPQAERFSSGSLLFWGAKRDHDLKTTLPLHPQIPKELSLPTLGILSLESLFLDCYVASLGAAHPPTHITKVERD